MTKEIHDINTRALDFVVELIEYIAEYPDDDYMTMECLCRKLFKYGLIDKKDGYYLVADGIKADRKTEPNLILPERMERGERFEVGETIVVMNCEDYYDLLCKSWEGKSHTDTHDEAIKAMATIIKAKTEPQPEVDCSWK